MKKPKLNLLIGTDIVDRPYIEKLARYSTVHLLADFAEDRLDKVLPEIDALLIFSWPKELTPDRLRIMSRLRFIQSILAGVNHIPFSALPSGVVVSSNAGAYSNEVAEYAWALLLSAAKRVVQLHDSLREEKWTLRRTLDEGTQLTILRDKVLGIVGFGGIGHAVKEMAAGFGMRVYAYARRTKRVKGIRLLTGELGLTRLLKESDAVVLAIPLTNQTTKIINREKLSQMKTAGILVNIARGELVDERDMYNHLVANPSFRYATDVWWYRESRESLKTDYPFLSLPNFIGTPHVSGPSGTATGRPTKMAVANMIRFLKGVKPENVVDRREYLTNYPY